MSPSASWVLVKADGTTHSGPWSDSPRRFLGGEGDVLLLERAGDAVVLAPGPAGRIEWLATVDVGAQSGEFLRRLAGPGIRSPLPVRVWCTEDGLLVLTDGPVENAYKARARLRAAAAQAGSQ